MKIVLSSSAKTLADPIDMRFGRARYLILTDTKSGRTQAYDNTLNLHATKGAGIQSAKTVAKLGAKVLLTGRVGAEAFRVLQQAGIAVALLDTVYSASEALRQYPENRLPLLDAPPPENP